MPNLTVLQTNIDLVKGTLDAIAICSYFSPSNLDKVTGIEELIPQINLIIAECKPNLPTT